MILQLGCMELWEGHSVATFVTSACQGWKAVIV